MTRNESNLDRSIRVIIGIALIAAWWLGWLSGTLAIISVIVGTVLVLTGLFGFCPIYAAFGLNTCPVKS